MSVDSAGTSVEVSRHVVRRVIQRTGLSFVTPSDLAYRFGRGIPIEVTGKRYTEARLVQIRATAFVFLRCDSHLTTALFASRETITFPEVRPDLECQGCDTVRRDASDNRICASCGSSEWSIRS